MARRRGMKIDNLKNRPAGIHVKLSDGELDAIHEAADSVKASVQYWVRTRLLAAAMLEREDGENSKEWKQVYVQFQEEADDDNQNPESTWAQLAKNE